MLLSLLLGCSNVAGFGGVDDAAISTCDDGSVVGLIVSSRRTCRPADSQEGEGTASFCDVVQAMSGGTCDRLLVQSDRSSVLMLLMEPDGDTTIQESPCASDPDDPDFGQFDDVDATFSIVERGQGAATLEFEGDLKGTLSVDDCGG